MTFFYQNTVYIFEDTGEQMIQGGVPLPNNSTAERFDPRINGSPSSGR